jgi:hypothetical protein
MTAQIVLHCIHSLDTIASLLSLEYPRNASICNLGDGFPEFGTLHQSLLFWIIEGV